VDFQPIREASYVGIPVIAFVDSDSPLKFVDVAIPANNKGQLSIGLLYYLLAREVLRLRGTIDRVQPWEVVVDLFFYRDLDELKEIEEKEKEKAAESGVVAYEGEGAAVYGAAEEVADYGAVPEGFTGATGEGWAAGEAAGQWGAATEYVAGVTPAQY